jgi:O-glycosyl hydrolase
VKISIKKIIGILCLIGLVAAGLSGGVRQAWAYSATVSGTNMQTVKGWGCTSYFYFTNNATVIQAMYSDLGMTIDRIYLDNTVGSDANGNVNTTKMDQVCTKISALNSRGLKYIICSWSPNIGMKTPAQVASADLRTDKEDAFSTYFVNICNYIKNKGLPLPMAVVVQNEPTTAATYDNMHFVGENTFDYSQYYRVVKALRTKLDNAGLSAVKLLGPEDGCYDTGNNWGCSMHFLGGSGFPALNDAALNTAVWGASAHSYNWGGGVTKLQQWASSCESRGKDKWMTEYSYIENGQTNVPLIDVAVMATRRFCSDMACVRNNYWFWWVGYGQSINRTEVLMSDDGTFTKYPLYYVLQKIYKSVPVGSIARRVSSTDPALHTADDIWMDGVAFLNGASTMVVLVNPAAAASTTSVNGLTGSTANVYQTTATQNMALVSSPAVSGGTISSVTLPAWSVTVIVTSGTGGTSGPVKVNCGGPAASPFVADADFSGGATATNWTGAVDTTGVTSPAPQAAYQSERYGASTYTMGGLTAGTSYTVRLHFCENYFTAAGQRKFNVAINGTSVLSSFDIHAASGAIHKANVQQFTATANASGQIVVALTNVTNNALINGIEVNAGVAWDPAAWYGFVCHTGGKAADTNNSTTSGTVVIQNGYNVTYWTQMWQIKSVTGGYYQLINRLSGMALDCNGSTTAGTSLVQKTSNASSTSQQWSITSDGGGYYHLVNRLSGMAADCNGSTAIGTPLVQKPSNTTYWDQQWQIVKN